MPRGALPPPLFEGLLPLLSVCVTFWDDAVSISHFGQSQKCRVLTCLPYLPQPRRDEIYNSSENWHHCEQGEEIGALYFFPVYVCVCIDLSQCIWHLHRNTSWNVWTIQTLYILSLGAYKGITSKHGTGQGARRLISQVVGGRTWLYMETLLDPMMAITPTENTT